MAKIKVVAAVVDTTKLILYRDDGSTISVPQGDPRLQALVNQVLPIVNSGGVAEVDMLSPNEYQSFEQQAGGVIRFFRAAKRLLVGGPSLDEPTGVVFGTLPTGEPAPEPAPSLPTKVVSAVESIMANAKPATDEDFRSDNLRSDETIVAIVENSAGEQKIIPGVEMISALVAHSAKNRNTVGVKNLFKRMAGYVDKRQHSVEDLLRFLEKGDLPIADDGSIVAYKSLQSTGDPNTFVDCHTRSIKQGVGDYVCVHESLVDKNRRNECSNGLHIGRRGYMKSFGGDVMVLCKIAPEDVIVVPHGDPNKVRVCGYHILARLSDDARSRLKQDRPMTEIKGLPELLGNVLAGNHVVRLRKVEVTAQMGKAVKVSETGESRKRASKSAKKKVVRQAKSARALDDAKAKKVVTVDPKKVAGQVTGGRQERAQRLFQAANSEGTFNYPPAKRIAAAKELIAFKKQVKIGWDRLGLSKEQVATVLNIAAGRGLEVTKPAPAPKPTRQAPIAPTAPQPASKPLSKAQELRQLHDSMLELQGYGDPKSLALAGTQARKLLDARRAAKKSWGALGLPDLRDEDLVKVVNAAPVNVPHPAPKPEPKGPTLVDQALKAVAKPAPPTEAQKQAFYSGEVDLPKERKAALALVRGGKSVSAASKETGVHRRTIERDFKKYGK